VSIGRINASDTANNGLLLRNLLGSSLPRENLAQIYSSGDNGDAGFFGHYYQIKDCDRQLGSLFYRLKSSVVDPIPINTSVNTAVFSVAKIQKLKFFLRRLLIGTGVYELLFSPRLSKEMKHWVEEFRPDIIFSQGYNLTFTWLPVLLKNVTGAKLAFLTSDDWPTYLYTGQLGEPIFFRWFMRPIVKAATRQLLSEVDVAFAFGQPMTREYSSRYGKQFLTVNHADSQLRFDSATTQRVNSSDITTIVAIGNYNKFRWPLLIDVNAACQFLHNQGINARLLVLSSAIEQDGIEVLSSAQFVDVLPDPGNDLLPSYLKGADILLLAEGFDEGFVSAIKLSISSKAHLFMFSHRPIIVYSHSDTGIAKYAQEFGWSKMVTHRSTTELAEAIRQLIEDKKQRESLIDRADQVAKYFHSHQANQDVLLMGLTSCLESQLESK
jgi:glycosyltransferase involved in cell wall biosynthesis